VGLGSGGHVSNWVVKLGGSVITCKDIPYCFRLDVMNNIAKQILRISEVSKVVLVHGGGSFGHYEASISDSSRTSRTSHSMITLNFLVNSILRDQNIPTYTVPGRFFSMNAVNDVLSNGMIPVIFGDILANGMVISGDDITIEIARNGYKAIFLTDVEGIMNSDGKVLECVESTDEFPLIDSNVSDVTGGILTKVRKILEAGINAIIANPGDENILRITSGIRVGTRVGKCD